MKSFGQIAGARLPRRVSVRLAGMGTAPGALVWQPAPPTSGDAAVARQLSRGVLVFDGRMAETLEPHPWDLSPPDRVWESALHGHGWLDDAAATGDRRSWDLLSAWVWSWLERFGDGSGPGWEPELAARRLTRWIAYSVRLLNGQPGDRSVAFFQALGMHTRYVDWRWRETPDGPARLEALAGLVYARLSLEGRSRDTLRAIAVLGREADRVIGPDGGIGSRSPEDLSRAITILGWSLSTMSEAGQTPAPAHLEALRRAEPVLAALRHPNGSLARFHGGRPARVRNREQEHQTPEAQPSADHATAMGFRRARCGTTVLILDAAPPPDGPHAATAHASPLAFELSSGRFPLVVNAGTGLAFGPRAAQSARRMAAHSGVELGQRCPGQLRAPDDGVARLTTPGTVRARVNADTQGVQLLGESTLYEHSLGLRLERRLHLNASGLKLSGEDTALATRAETRLQMATAFPDQAPACPMTLRLHLHPNAHARMALNGRAVSIRPPDGSIWMFIADTDLLDLEDSAYYDEAQLRPRLTRQIVARTTIMEYWGRITWSLERLPEGSSPLSLRPADT
ncbi:MAG: heparinase II/III family protein [Pseudomonadota bacterium]